MNLQKLIASLTIVAILYVLASMWLQELNRQGFEDSVPAEFEITDTLSSQGLVCGGAIFKISDATILKINSEGLNFFAHAIKPRVIDEGRYSSYLAWRETPVPERDLGGEGLWFKCLENKIVKDIVDAAGKTGAYYSTSTDRRAMLIVSPSLGVFAYSFWD